MTTAYTCKCGCGFDVIDPRVPEVFEAVRTVSPGAKVTSACRCTEHNRAVGGKPNSAHLSGLACDIACVGSASRFAVIKALLEHGVRRIGLAGSFVHFDLDESKPQDVIFFY
jgi:zinc D-Ala-D-Ala carboxypeptidase